MCLPLILGGIARLSLPLLACWIALPRAAADRDFASLQVDLGASGARARDPGEDPSAASDGADDVFDGRWSSGALGNFTIDRDGSSGQLVLRQVANHEHIKVVWQREGAWISGNISVNGSATGMMVRLCEGNTTQTLVARVLRGSSEWSENFTVTRLPDAFNKTAVRAFNKTAVRSTARIRSHAPSTSSRLLDAAQNASAGKISWEEVENEARKSGVITDANDPSGHAALTIAVDQAPLEVVDAMLQHGLVVNATHTVNVTAISHLVERSSPRDLKMIEFLIAKGAPVTDDDVKLAAQHGNWEALDQLLSQGNESEAKRRLDVIGPIWREEYESWTEDNSANAQLLNSDEVTVVQDALTGQKKSSFRLLGIVVAVLACSVLAWCRYKPPSEGLLSLPWERDSAKQASPDALAPDGDTDDETLQCPSASEVQAHDAAEAAQPPVS